MFPRIAQGNQQSQCKWVLNQKFIQNLLLFICTNKNLNINFHFSFFYFWLSDNDKEIHAISDESEFSNANEDEINEPPNAILRDFDDYLINDVGYVTANNDDNVVYNDQLYFEESIQDKKTVVFVIECVCGVV